MDDVIEDIRIFRPNQFIVDPERKDFGPRSGTLHGILQKAAVKNNVTRFDFLTRLFEVMKEMNPMLTIQQWRSIAHGSIAAINGRAGLSFERFLLYLYKVMQADMPFEDEEMEDVYDELDQMRLINGGRDLRGAKFGRLTALECLGVSDDGKSNLMWLCACESPAHDDPVYCTVNSYYLTSGTTKSCDCLRREATGDRFRTHGMSHRPEYSVWIDMHKRCTNENCKSYPRYGGRGIKVVDRWNDFVNFFEDMGERPSDDHSIEREENDGNYEPGNCYWATDEEQAANKSNTLRVEGYKWTLGRLCREYDLSYQKARKIYHEEGITEKNALIDRLRL